MANIPGQSKLSWHPGFYGAAELEFINDKEIGKRLNEEVDRRLDEEVGKRLDERVLAALRSLIQNTKWTAEQAMAAISIPPAERARYAAKLRSAVSGQGGKKRMTGR